jgi:hypothetical protein
LEIVLSPGKGESRLYGHPDAFFPLLNGQQKTPPPERQRGSYAGYSGRGYSSSLSTRTVHRATRDATIGGCQLNTLARIGGSLGVKTKRLYDEVEGPPREEGTEPEEGKGEGR